MKMFACALVLVFGIFDNIKIGRIMAHFTFFWFEPSRNFGTHDISISVIFKSSQPTPLHIIGTLVTILKMSRGSCYRCTSTFVIRSIQGTFLVLCCVEI